jgi:hypothetical protein
MTASILDFVDNKEVLEYARRLDPMVYFGLQLFKPRTVEELDYKYIKGAGGSQAPIMAEVVAWESEAPLAPHESLETVEGELPPIKQKSRYSEQEVIKIFNPRSTRERRATIDRLFNEIQGRVDGIHSRLNWIIMQSLGLGTVTFTSEGNKLSVDWGVPDDNQTDPKNWDDVDAGKPLEDMQALQSVIKDATGALCDRAITTNKVVAALLANESIKKSMFGTSETSRILTLDALNQFLASLGLPVIYSYDESARTVGSDYALSAPAKFYPAKRLTMFPSSEILGETLFGPTAEGIRGLGAEEAPGIFAEVFEKRDPVSVWTYAVASGFPTFPGADMIGIIEATNA